MFGFPDLLRRCLVFQRSRMALAAAVAVAGEDGRFEEGTNVVFTLFLSLYSISEHLLFCIIWGEANFHRRNLITLESYGKLEEVGRDGEFSDRSPGSAGEYVFVGDDWGSQDVEGVFAHCPLSNHRGSSNTLQAAVVAQRGRREFAVVPVLPQAFAVCQEGKTSEEDEDGVLRVDHPLPPHRGLRRRQPKSSNRQRPSSGIYADAKANDRDGWEKLATAHQRSQNIDVKIA
nr:hypothetical protein Iba_chr06cCG12940 [Ipomoea batatas]